MKYYSFQIVIEKEPEDPGYYAYSPTLPGCFSNGRSIEDARRNIREAIEQRGCRRPCDDALGVENTKEDLRQPALEILAGLLRADS